MGNLRTDVKGWGCAAVQEGLDVDRLRLVTKVARLYHARGLRQAEIAERLRLSQPRVSRLLAHADRLEIVRSIVAVPTELNRELELGLGQAYGLRDVHVVDAVAGDEELAVDLGRAAAPFLATALATGDVRTIGFMPWSRTLRHAVESLRPLPLIAGCVVEMLGDLGAPALQQDVAHQTQRLATLIGASTAFLRVPGVVANPALRAALLRADPHARRILRLLDDLDLALLSVGPCQVVPPLRAGDNYFTDEQFDQARRAGAVGQVCLRFLGADGSWVRTPLDDMVVGVTVDQLRRARYRWAVAGGADKYPVLRAALVGGWINRLVTDTVTATHLLSVAPA
jgi:DNA-binding transcriptional regulator LsrR (DeoR family)